MKDSIKYRDLLARYIAGELDATEIASLEEWLNSDEKHRKYSEELKTAWNVAGAANTAKIDLEAEWTIFQESVRNGQEVIISETPAVAAGSRSNGRIARNRKFYQAIAVAAALLLVVSATWMFITMRHAPESKINNASPTFVHHQVKNTSGKEETITLSDGSTVILSDQGEINYEEPFKQKRHIALNGQAYFKVAKGQANKFIVGTGNITTTAIGTEFMVNYNKLTKAVMVRLYESAVIVERNDENNKGSNKPIYLYPGQELVYADTSATVSNFDRDVAPDINRIATGKKPDAFVSSGSSSYSFVNQPLNEVFNALSNIYHVKIDYSHVNVSSIYFTGKYKKSYPVEKVLKRITTINNLTLISKDTAFIITN